MKIEPQNFRKNKKSNVESSDRNLMQLWVFLWGFYGKLLSSKVCYIRYCDKCDRELSPAAMGAN